MRCLSVQRIIINNYSSALNNSKVVEEKPKKRVAAYCRVSSKMEEQQLSFETQRQVYTDKINNNPDWELAGIYSDEGYTGTLTELRSGFQSMMADCESGNIDIVITKSISRFSRNTLDALENIYKLRDIGVRVIFEKENIDTEKPYSDMLLSVLAAFAQEESRSLSENLKWGIRKRYENGQNLWRPMYGYCRKGDEKYIVFEPEAKYVRQVFDMYESGIGTLDIARYMNSKGVKTPTGANEWTFSTVQKILASEQYVGDMILQKKYTLDHISHKEVLNNGVDVPMYYIKDHHTPIISREQYERCIKIREMKCCFVKGDRSQGNHARYPYGDKLLYCPRCGKALTPRRTYFAKGECSSYRCEGCGACRDFVIEKSTISNSILKAYNEMTNDKIMTAPDGEQAKIFITMKERYPSFDDVEFVLLDKLINRIVIGKHSCDLSITSGEACDRYIDIFWKCGLKTRIYTDTYERHSDPNRLVSILNERANNKGVSWDHLFDVPSRKKKK